LLLCKGGVVGKQLFTQDGSFRFGDILFAEPGISLQY
jgi:hypothetical protein